jgi:AcrR family transcriptional regulator
VEKSSGTREQLLDAAERLLIRDGYARLSTRRIVEEAGASHGLIRYHFGSLEKLIEAMFERATGAILARQRTLFAAKRPFIEKWEQAMNYWDVDLAAGYPKLLAELHAMAWNDAAWRPLMARSVRGYQEMLRVAVEAAAKEYELDDLDIESATTLLRLFQTGVLFDRVGGVRLGHARLNQAIHAWLLTLKPRRQSE